MALFGRKKTASDAEDELVVAPGSASDNDDLIPDEEDDTPGKLDLDAFAEDFQPQTPAPGAKTAFDAELDALNNPQDLDTFGGEPTVEAVSEPETLDLNKMFEVESRQAAAAGKGPAPFVPPSLKESEFPEPSTPFYDPQVALPPVEEKKKLPLIPLIGVAAILILGAGGVLFMNRGGSTDDVGVEPTTESMAPAAVNSAPAAPPVSSASPVAATKLSPAVEAKLKELWKKGAAAKQRKDYAGARAAWSEALKLDPGHPGFADSIAKLPAG